MGLTFTMYRYTLHMSLGEVCRSTCLVWAVLAHLSQFSHLLTGAGGVWGGAGVALQRGWGGSPGVSLSLPCSDALSNALKPNKSEKTAISDQFCMHYTILSLTFLYLHIICISLCISTHLTKYFWPLLKFTSGTHQIFKHDCLVVSIYF